MEFDIIEVSDSYYARLSFSQRKLLRAAQQKKDALVHRAQKEIKLFRQEAYTNYAQNSSLIEQKQKEIYNELEYQIDILREELLYSISFDGQSSGNVTGNVGYRVDYSLSYAERYVIVRDYYLSIPDSGERISRYLADDVAKKYLDKYYTSLYNVLITYS